MTELAVCHAYRSSGKRHPDAGQYLIAPQGGRQTIDEEIVDRYDTCAARTCGFQSCLEREGHRRPISTGIRVGERATKCPSIANRWIGHQIGGLSHDRQEATEFLRIFDLAVGREWPDLNRALTMF